ncbi:MAG: aldehyde dehydrogenase, partial [Candidatus Dadabacteria bacterium]
MRYAETGFRLEVDLTKGTIAKVPTDPKWTEMFLGGQGTAAKILWDRVGPEVQPFDPENLLIFTAGLLVGTPVPGANRTMVNTISPQTNLFAHSIFGAFFGPELKQAGYDQIVFTGESPDWVYLWIHNDTVELRDARHLLGKGPQTVTKMIREELGQPEAQVAAIGLAGENRVYMATIESASGSASRGVGAVMGAKKLKAIAVRGTKDIQIAHPEELFKLSIDMFKAIGDNPYTGDIMAHEDDEEFHVNNFAWGNARKR